MIICAYCGYTGAKGTWGYSQEYQNRSEYRAYCTSCHKMWTALVSIDLEIEGKTMNLVEIAKHTIAKSKKYSVRPLAAIEDRIVAAIEADLCDRAGLSDNWSHINPSVTEEILEVWREIIRQEIGAPSPHELSAFDLSQQINSLMVVLNQKLEEESEKRKEQ